MHIDRESIDAHRSMSRSVVAIDESIVERRSIHRSMSSEEHICGGRHTQSVCACIPPGRSAINGNAICTGFQVSFWSCFQEYVVTSRSGMRELTPVSFHERSKCACIPPGRCNIHWFSTLLLVLIQEMCGQACANPRRCLFP